MTLNNITNCNINTTGKVKAIGVSNYTIHHLEELFTHAAIKPHVLQVLIYNIDLLM